VAAGGLAISPVAELVMMAAAAAVAGNVLVCESAKKQNRQSKMIRAVAWQLAAHSIIGVRLSNVRPLPISGAGPDG